ncbi:MAG: VWA domain-containing protein [Melioribacteraceae bacterium]|nr:VWA domain-containing protein [Melioribacteraceae bacterium]
MDSHITKKNDTVIKQEVDSWLENINTDLKAINPAYVTIGEVYILLDASWSMNEYRKLEQAKEGALSYAQEALSLGYKIGLISFHTEVWHHTAPTTDLEIFSSCLKRIHATGTTNMTEAIRTGAHNLQHPQLKRMLCIITDGIPDDKRSTLKEAERVKKLGIDIMTIGTDLADEAFLKELASKIMFTKRVEREELSTGISSMAKKLIG